MAIITLPTARDMVPAELTWGTQPNVSTSTSPLSGAVQTIERPGVRWTCTLRWPDARGNTRNALEALMLSLRHGQNRLRLSDLRAGCGTPRGTALTSGVTVSAAAPQFAESITLTGLGAGGTLLAGDKFAVALANGLSQLLMITVAATANASGVATVALHTMLRGAVSAGAAVALDRPTALFVPLDPKGWAFGGTGGALGGLRTGFSRDFVEVFL